MDVIKFHKLQTPDRMLNMIQDNISEALNPITQQPILNGNILTNVSLAIGENTIQHGLGRILVGWYLVRVRGSVLVYDNQDANLTPNLTLVLVASAARTVDIAVF